MYCRQMATTCLFNATSFLLLASLVVASASDYGYGAEPADDGKPETEVKGKALPIGIEGLILCKSGLKLIPIQGAMARIRCIAVDEHGYERAPFSISSGATDAKGYFLATLYPSELHGNLKVTECKAFLEDSPLEDCNVPTDVNKGVTGARLFSHRILKNKKIKLYSVGPFFFTSEPHHRSPSDGY